MAQRAESRHLDLAPDAGDEVELTGAVNFETFYQREILNLVAFARALTGSRTLAEDLAQEAMLTAYRRWDDISMLDKPEAWVRRVCANQAVSNFRRTVVEIRSLRVLSRMRQPEPPQDEVTEHELFWAQVRTLPKRQAQAIALHYMYDLTVADIAQTMGCSEASVKTHLQRARASLANHLTPGGTP